MYGLGVCWVFPCSGPHTRCTRGTSAVFYNSVAIQLHGSFGWRRCGAIFDFERARETSLQHLPVQAVIVPDLRGQHSEQQVARTGLAEVRRHGKQLSYTGGVGLLLEGLQNSGVGAEAIM